MNSFKIIKEKPIYLHLDFEDYIPVLINSEK